MELVLWRSAQGEAEERCPLCYIILGLERDWRQNRLSSVYVELECEVTYGMMKRWFPDIAWRPRSEGIEDVIDFVKRTGWWTDRGTCSLAAAAGISAPLEREPDPETEALIRDWVRQFEGEE